MTSASSPSPASPATGFRETPSVSSGAGINTWYQQTDANGEAIFSNLSPGVYRGYPPGTTAYTYQPDRVDFILIDEGFSRQFRATPKQGRAAGGGAESVSVAGAHRRSDGRGSAAPLSSRQPHRPHQQIVAGREQAQVGAPVLGVAQPRVR